MMNHTHPTYPPRRVQGKLLATSYHSVFVSACTTHHATGKPGKQNSDMKSQAVFLALYMEDM